MTRSMLSSAAALVLLLGGCATPPAAKPDPAGTRQALLFLLGPQGGPGPAAKPATTQPSPKVLVSE